MNLICFPHYTCGGLLCDIFSNKFSSVRSDGGINSFNHSIGKIGDSDSVLLDYDPEFLLAELNKNQISDSDWVGTHCWPGKLELSNFDQIINVTTSTHRSKLYRWARVYHHYYSKSQPWITVHGQERIDKERETAKNYLIAFEPVYASNVINIEFCEIVEDSQQFRQLCNNNIDPHLQRWKTINDFLYEPNIWTSPAFVRFYEAEFEQNLGKHYVYQ